MRRRGLEFDVSGLGNALVDALVVVDEDRPLLAELGLVRGHMTPVEHGPWQAARDRLEPYGVHLQSGGSCANTIATLGMMGLRTIYCGQVGDDELGSLYQASMIEACGRVAVQVSAERNTGKCLSIVSGTDAERTMLTDLGAAVHLPGLGEFAGMIGNSGLLHLTGYLLLGEPMATRAREAAAAAKAAGVPISLDVADPFVVSAVRDLMWTFVRDHAEVVFLNAEEATALTGLPPEDAVDAVAEHAHTVVVKLGARGSIVRRGAERIRVGAHLVQAVDTTGAGDAYAAGYLYGHVLGWSAAQSADLGSRVAALAVGQLGAVVRDPAALARAVAAARSLAS